MSSIIIEHLYGFQRILVEVFPDKAQLLHDIVRYSDDVASDCVGLEDIQEFLRTGPDRLTG